MYEYSSVLRIKQVSPDTSSLLIFYKISLGLMQAIKHASNKT